MDANTKSVLEALEKLAEGDICRCDGGPLLCDHCAGGTFAGPLHPDCGTRANMHAGCVDCCDCDECGLDRAARLRRATLDRELEEVGAVVIQVEDLGAALEANWLGTFPGRPRSLRGLDAST